jgi:hypothetical protein
MDFTSSVVQPASSKAITADFLSPWKGSFIPNRQAVDPGHHQRIAFTNELQDRFQFVALRGRRPGRLFVPDHLTPGARQRGYLQGEILIGGAYTAISVKQKALPEMPILKDLIDALTSH